MTLKRLLLCINCPFCQKQDNSSPWSLTLINTICMSCDIKGTVIIQFLIFLTVKSVWQIPYSRESQLKESAVPRAKAFGAVKTWRVTNEVCSREPSHSGLEYNQVKQSKIIHGWLDRLLLLWVFSLNCMMQFMHDCMWWWCLFSWRCTCAVLCIDSNIR